MKKLHAVLIISAIFFACREPGQLAINVNFGTIEIERNNADLSTDTSIRYHVSIKYLSPADAPAGLRDSIMKFTVSFFSAWFPSDVADFDLNTAVKEDMIKFLSASDAVKSEGDYLGDRCFDLRVEAETPYQNKALISLIYSWSLYEGGAHGNHAKYCINISKTSGERITYSHLIKDEAALLSVAELWFRNMHGMNSDEEMYRIYDFGKGRFRLSENFALTVNGLTFYYNPYEIAPYSAGQIQFTVPYSELRDCINFLD
ncbi:MAG: DUF3298 and DUF4163 domain-containing protein [Prevotellaceae bacterium]|nr:DUF3298 and DUF4163 domain-containing protein [Prevotellaceae bacterium]